MSAAQNKDTGCGCLDRLDEFIDGMSLPVAITSIAVNWIPVLPFQIRLRKAKTAFTFLPHTECPRLSLLLCRIDGLHISSVTQLLIVPDDGNRMAAWAYMLGVITHLSLVGNPVEAAAEGNGR